MPEANTKLKSKSKTRPHGFFLDFELCLDFRISFLAFKKYSSFRKFLFSRYMIEVCQKLLQ